jgi:hypothetical protein
MSQPWGEPVTASYKANRTKMGSKNMMNGYHEPSPGWSVNLLFPQNFSGHRHPDAGRLAGALSAETLASRRLERSLPANPQTSAGARVQPARAATDDTAKESLRHFILVLPRTPACYRTANAKSRKGRETP